MPQLNKRVRHTFLSGCRPCVEALHPRRHRLGDDLLLALLAQEVGHHAGDPLCERHALDLLVLHVAAQHQRRHVLVEAYRLRGVDDVATVLADCKGALRVEVRQAGVHFGQERALDRGSGAQRDLLGDAPVEQVGAEHLDRHGLLSRACEILLATACQELREAPPELRAQWAQHRQHRRLLGGHLLDLDK
jgi:hypothetical protein